jgi:crotonobetainyl-CoA:carnitine CoA-transferase CaiB-like acyl-CoA transferase
VHTVLEAFSQPHAVHRGMQVDLDGYRGIGVPVRLSQTPGRPTRRPPRLGQHAREVLDEAGLDEARIDHLQEIGVCS